MKMKNKYKINRFYKKNNNWLNDTLEKKNLSKKLQNNRIKYQNHLMKQQNKEKKNRVSKYDKYE